ncbi:MAG: DUF6470 family protein [Lawsonibacter sp.]|nr:DUF6470 family protein [Lawsonibacter sp.]
MYPLIEIKTIPIQIQMNIKDASLEHTRGTAEMEISRTEGGLNIKSRPIRLHLDTFDARSSISPTTMQSVDQAAQKGKQSAYEATATYARQGQLLLNAKIGQELVTQFAEEAQEKHVMTNVGLSFLPTTGPNIQWEDGQIQIRYEMDKLNFDWKIGAGEFKFTPGDIEISVEQMPDVIIKYVGGPIYVPPSTDPSYVPLDTEA